MSARVAPRRGEVWQVNLNPVRGREQAGERPALVISIDLFNEGPAGLVVVVPITKQEKGIPFHVEVQPPEGGLDVRSFIKVEDVRSISKERLVRPRGMVREETLAQVEDRLRILLDL